MPVELDLLREAVQEAGKIASGYWRKEPKVWDKGGAAGPVSEADLHTDRFLRATLTAARPEYGWLSEETEDDKARLARERTFIVDPIDGTRSFLAGEKPWAISAAVVERGEIIAGVVAMPMLDLLFAAEKGRGATLNSTPIQTSEFTSVERAQVLLAKPALEPSNWKGAVPPLQRNFRPSLAYRLALVAQGRFDGMLTLRSTWEWDVAAGMLIASEAGAVATDRRGQMPRFNNAHPQIDGALVANPGLHAALRDQLHTPGDMS